MNKEREERLAQIMDPERAAVCVYRHFDCAVEEGGPCLNEELSQAGFFEDPYDVYGTEEHEALLRYEEHA